MPPPLELDELLLADDEDELEAEELDVLLVEVDEDELDDAPLPPAPPLPLLEVADELDELAPPVPLLVDVLEDAPPVPEARSSSVTWRVPAWRPGALATRGRTTSGTVLLIP
jgi:hypothetical protein